jgi:hypothetical protein
LFDVLLYNDATAKARIAREFPEKPWPDKVQAFMTRDWPSVLPGRKAGFQAGFLAIRPNPAVFDEVVDVIKTTNYTPGFGRDNGWGGRGYGAYVGAMAMQGVVAYYYDVFRPTEWVELHQCRHNHMGIDVTMKGKCRNDRTECENCMTTDLSLIHSIHYTWCRKPWNCIGEGRDTERGKLSFIEPSVRKEHCLELLSAWHRYRTDLETKLYELTADETILQGQTGTYKREFFGGHCTKNNGYLQLAGRHETLQRIPELYK